MATTIPQRELRNEVSAVLRRVEAGEEFVVTVSGRPVAELRPVLRRRRFVPADELFAAVAPSTPLDPGVVAGLQAVDREVEAMDDDSEGGGVTALLDTSVLVGIEQGRVARPAVPADAAVSAITLEELWLGVLRAQGQVRAGRQRTYTSVSSLFDVLPVDGRVATACAEIRADGRARGVRYGPFDSLIAATARVHGLTLVTQDEGMVGMLGVDVQVV